jgi:hypothetical protein
MDKFVGNLVQRNSDSGRKMLATYKDRLSFLRRIDNLEPIVSSDVENVAADPAGGDQSEDHSCSREKTIPGNGRQLEKQKRD